MLIPVAVLSALVFPYTAWTDSLLQCWVCSTTWPVPPDRTDACAHFPAKVDPPANKSDEYDYNNEVPALELVNAVSPKDKIGLFSWCVTFLKDDGGYGELKRFKGRRRNSTRDGLHRCFRENSGSTEVIMGCVCGHDGCNSLDSDMLLEIGETDIVGSKDLSLWPHWLEHWELNRGNKNKNNNNNNKALFLSLFWILAL